MIFTATEEQIYQIFTNAINASKPIGLGKIHYKDVLYTVNEVRQWATPNRVGFGAWFEVDYFEGRMVKLSVYRKDDQWILRGEPKIDYQSWSRVYPTYEALVESVIK